MCFRCRFTRVAKEHKPFEEETIKRVISYKSPEDPAKSLWTVSQVLPNTLFLKSFILGKGGRPLLAFLSEKSGFLGPALYNKPGNFSQKSATGPPPKTHCFIVLLRFQKSVGRPSHNPYGNRILSTGNTIVSLRFDKSSRKVTKFGRF